MENSQGTSRAPPKSGSPLEFKLKSGQTSNHYHNLMTLVGPSVNISDFTTPVRLVRDPSISTRAVESSSLNQSGVEDEPETDLKKQSNRAVKKRKTKIIHPEDKADELSLLKSQEKVPWLLEDFDGQHSYTGHLVMPDAKYVIFVNQGSEFRVILANKWYKFSPRLAYHPLTLEEAEEKMAGKSKHEDFDRWLMKKRIVNSSTDPLNAEDENGNVGILTKTSLNRLEKRLVNLAEESFDFTEFVDDDDGDAAGPMGEGLEDDPSIPTMAPKPKLKNLSNAGKQVKYLVKNLDRSNYLYDSDEDKDDKDPYADEDDLVDSDEEAREKYNNYMKAFMPTSSTDKIATQGPASRPALVQKVHSTQQITQKHTVGVKSPPVSRGRSPGPASTNSARNHSPASSHVPIDRARSRSPQSVNMGDGTGTSGSRVPSYTTSPAPTISQGQITESEIISILRGGPMKTKDLISRVKNKLKSDPSNKDLFREIVRKVASVKQALSQDDDKLLELKPEYR